jgi:putative ABC transport system permease protein
MAAAATIAEKVRPVARVALIVNGSARVTPDTGRARAATVVATTPAASQLLRKPLAAGRFFTDADVRDSQRVAVISHELGRVIAPGGVPATAIGRMVKLEGSDFRVVGVASNESQRASLAAYVPLTTSKLAMAPGSGRNAPSIYVRALRVEDVPVVKKSVEEWLTSHTGKWQDRVTVSGGDGLRLDQARQAVLIFKTVMGAFAGISLLVGGIGIMNVLLSGVLERTREIGIRKATGARNRDILVQFLSESVAITSVGAIIGVVLGLAGAFVIAALIRNQTQAEVHAAFTLTTMLVATLVSVSIGIAFGTYPALRASRLSPIDAVRHE